MKVRNFIDMTVDIADELARNADAVFPLSVLSIR
jgi:hypothetical protein